MIQWVAAIILLISRPSLPTSGDTIRIRAKTGHVPAARISQGVDHRVTPGDDGEDDGEDDGDGNGDGDREGAGDVEVGN